MQKMLSKMAIKVCNDGSMDNLDDKGRKQLDLFLKELGPKKKRYVYRGNGSPQIKDQYDEKLKELKDLPYLSNKIFMVGEKGKFFSGK